MQMNSVLAKIRGNFSGYNNMSGTKVRNYTLRFTYTIDSHWRQATTEQRNAEVDEHYSAICWLY